MNEKEFAAHLAASAPKLTEKELGKLNDLFPAYIFRCNKTHEIWTSCCGQHIKLRDSEWKDKFQPILVARHEPEPRLGIGSTRYCHYSASDTIEDRILTECPFCGKLAAVKELGRTGNRQNLRNWQRAVIFRQYRGALWVRAYECEKDYEGPETNLTLRPSYTLLSVYRFKIGKAERSFRGWYSDRFDGYESMDSVERKLKIPIHEPFGWHYVNGMYYDLINTDEVLKSDFRYCGLDEFANHSNSIMKFLTVAAMYPRQTEMLLKAGMCEAVKDLVDRNIRNSRAFDWEKEKPMEAFGLTKPEMREFMETDRNVRVLRYYKRLKKNGECLRMEDIESKLCMLSGKEAEKLITWCGEHHMKVAHVMNYLNQFTGGCHVGGGYRDFQSIYRLWQDYLTAAEALHCETWKQNIALPADLFSAHDKATATHRSKLEKERLAAEKEKLELQRKAYAERRLLLEKKYAFAADDLIVVVPKDADEIIAEGKALEHCVGGYAYRHMEGIVTILFLRRASAPEKSYETIEMDGNTLKQLHGYKNEGVYSSRGRFAPDPLSVHAEFLDKWISWLKCGSPRDKDGLPVMRKNKKKKEAAA